METIKLPKDTKGNVLRPGADVFLAVDGSPFRIDGFVFGVDGRVTHAIEYRNGGKTHNKVPVYLLEVEEPDEGFQKASRTALVMVTLVKLQLL